ncbi:hypothetical protein ALQ33_05210 [Pseudomonas syringae pv. philadelphi]|uniref:Calpastatin n=2 Tax=Pseudomonas syringae group genomosp. 3 TaxID=251701 RepID=A0A3M3YTN9_9PSED|nr:hypothetical protein ALQ33_05210 [Pseudomonas syringae pv. philadelphi]
MQLHRRDHGVNDALPQPGGQRGQQASNERGQDQADGQRARGGPDQVHGPQGLLHENGEALEDGHTQKTLETSRTPVSGGHHTTTGSLKNRKLIMNDVSNLQRFVTAQQPVFRQVLTELEAGLKRSHWMWFVFPQIQGLGHSDMAQRFAISDLDEARAYLQHPLLGARLEQCAGVIAPQVERTARQMFGSPDDMKLRSSMTLFAIAAPDRSVFQEVLDAFFKGERDAMTVKLLS